MPRPRARTPGRTVDRADVERWVAGYERAWRSAGTASLGDLFSPDVTYSPSPWSQSIEGLDALARFWDDEREGPDERFDLRSEIVALDTDTAVVRVFVDYAGAGRRQRWRDLWVIQFDGAGRCVAFEEWPFAPDQDDGHDRSV